MMREKDRFGPSSVLLDAFHSIESNLRRYLIRFVVREQDIEDIVQETFLRAYESGQSQEIRSPRAFLFRVARNIALSELARSSNRLTVHMGDLEALHVIDDKANAEQELDTQRRLEALGAIVATLPPQCRRVLIMRKIFGFTHKETARHMEISVRTVEKHLARALQRCQELGREVSDDASQDVSRNIRTAAHDD